MAKPSRKTALVLWWYEYRSRVISFTVVVLTFLIILAVFYPFSSEIIIGEVRAVTLSKTNIDTQPRVTIYSPNTGEIVMAVPFGVNLTVADQVEISRGKTMAGIYRYVFVKKVSSSNESL
jgi:hypothetical protein